MSGHHHGSVLLADEQVSIDLSNHEPSKSLMQTQALVYDETVSFLILSHHNEVNEHLCIVFFVF